jgi:UDP-N-acetylmuramate dehydrogenase
MDERQRSGLLELMHGGVVFDLPMGQMTTYRVGGNAEAACYAGELPGLCSLITYLNSEGIPWLVVGKGSNILVKDGGIKGAVIVLKGSLASLKETGTEEPMLMAGGGLAITELLIHCRNSGLSGLEFLAGIPGTLGGAIFMNAGACGEEIGDVVREIFAVNAEGASLVIDARDLRFTYRSSSIPAGTVIYGARLMLQRGERKKIAGMIASNLKGKKAAQPLEYPSAGSVFKNPPGDYAGRLIERSGLKGTRIGGAMISEKHANFILNTGGAKASDILGLIDLVRTRVKEDTGIILETEIRILGD